MVEQQACLSFQNPGSDPLSNYKRSCKDRKTHKKFGSVLIYSHKSLLAEGLTSLATDACVGFELTEWIEYDL